MLLTSELKVEIAETRAAEAEEDCERFTGAFWIAGTKISQRSTFAAREYVYGWALRDFLALAAMPALPPFPPAAVDPSSIRDKISARTSDRRYRLHTRWQRGRFYSR